MMTRLYQHLLVRLMPNNLLDAIQELYEIGQFCVPPQYVDDVRAFSVLESWLDRALAAGWLPPQQRTATEVIAAKRTSNR